MKKGDFIWAAVFIMITLMLIIPGWQRAFVAATTARPYMMGFAKFAVMATMGELLVLRIMQGRWIATTGMVYKTIIWGLIGMCIVLMFVLFSEGVATTIAWGYMAGASGFGGQLLQAFYTSLIMNLTFGPVFMAVHRISDTYIDMRAKDKSITLSLVIDRIDWQGFIRFVVGKTIPFFWIPAHTVTFMLPPQYRVLMAAYLSIALGLILAYARRRKT